MQNCCQLKIRKGEEDDDEEREEEKDEKEVYNNFLAIDPVAQGVPQGPICGPFHFSHVTYYMAYFFTSLLNFPI